MRSVSEVHLFSMLLGLLFTTEFLSHENNRSVISTSDDRNDITYTYESTKRLFWLPKRNQVIIRLYVLRSLSS